MKKRMIISILLLAFAITAGCGDSDSDSTTNNGSGDDVVVDRGPTALDIQGDANGLLWDDADQALYIADDNNNRILKWDDTDGFTLVADLPQEGPKGAGLGQLVRMSDGTFVVTRFGHGSAGDIAYVKPDGTAEVVPNLDPERRRIGLTVTDDGQLFSSWFVRLSSGDRQGAVGKVDLEAGTETEVITGLIKPAGVLAVGEKMYVSDQDLGQILSTTVADPQDYSVLAEMEKPDLINLGPDGSLLAGSVGGELLRINLDTGATSIVESGFQQIRGVAYDPTNKRAFVADHDSDDISHAIQIVPMED